MKIFTHQKTIFSLESAFSCLVTFFSQPLEAIPLTPSFLNTLIEVRTQKKTIYIIHEDFSPSDFRLCHACATPLDSETGWTGELWPKTNLLKGNRTIADLRYGGKDLISPSKLIFSPIKSYLRIYTLHISPEILQKLALT